METAYEGAQEAGRQIQMAAQRGASRLMQQALDEIIGDVGQHYSVETMQEQYHGLLEIDTPSGPTVVEV